VGSEDNEQSQIVTVAPYLSSRDKLAFILRDCSKRGFEQHSNGEFGRYNHRVINGSDEGSV